MTLLLFDENLSESLVRRLADIYPNALHVRTLGHGGALDPVAWLNVGNARTARVAVLLRASQASIERLVADPEGSYLALTFGAPTR